MTQRFSFFYFFPPTLWAVFILIISLMPATEIPGVGLFQADKLVHIAVYFLLTFLYHRSIKKSGIKQSFEITILLAASIISYGFLIEVAQESLTADRQFDLWDVVANSIGTLLFIIAKQWL
jgi:VanZ family protein